MATLRVCIMQGHQEDPNVLGLREVTNEVDIPVDSEHRQWTVWSEIVSAYSESPLWVRSDFLHGYVFFTHKELHSLRTVVFTTMY